MLKLYAIFHCNLAFSMIPSAHYPRIIERCYRPLLAIARRVPIGIEMSACTLKEVNRLDPSFVAELKELWLAGKCEFIGSGFSQAIFPLIPVDVNRWNLEAGGRLYEELLGRRPKTALINEQTYSKGLVDLYTEAGYKTVIMDWNNCFQHNRYPEEYSHFPQKAAGFNSEINVLWSNSIAFQKFQRTIHSELAVEKYLEYLFGEYEQGSDRAFIIYCNDAEVFDYRPGHDTDADGEYERISQLLSRLATDHRAELLVPEELVESFSGHASAFKSLQLESVEMPVVTKKQGKYNPVRWAVAGRDSTHINTECYKLYDSIRSIIAAGNLVEDDLLIRMKETLVELWASDFRTNTIDEKFFNFHRLLGWLKVETEAVMAGSAQLPRHSVVGAASGAALGLDLGAGMLVSGREDGLGGDEKAEITSTGNLLKVSTETVVAEFLTNKGLAIKGLIFPAVSQKPLIGTLDHGYYNDMSLGADFFSGHLIHLTKDALKSTDLLAINPEVEENSSSVTISVKVTLQMCTLWKTYTISKYEPKVRLSYRLKVNGLVASSLRLGIFTALPSGFERSSLWCESVNGGDMAERFFLEGHNVTHDQPPCPGVSASACLGATDGVVTIGDSEKSVRIEADKSRLYSVPMVSYTDVDDSFFLRIYHSIGELDDTAWWVWRGYNEAVFTISAKRT